MLGALEVRDGDRVVEIRRGIPRLLLLALILRAGETVSSDTLAEIIWGDDQPAHPANALQTQISYLRKALAAVSPPDRQPLATRPGGYVLDIPPEHVDAVRFQKAVERGRRQADVGTAPALAAALDEFDGALALWRGEALADSGGHHFALGDVTRLEELKLSATEARLDCLLALGRHGEAAGDLAALVADHPLRERFYEQLMLALYRSGRQADALRTYDRARKVLAEQLGLDPGPSLQRMERLVFEQSPELAWTPPPAGEPPPSESPGTSAGGPRPRRGAVPVPVSRLIGRESDVARVTDLLDRGRLVTLTGLGGAGKTSLALDIAGRAVQEGAVWFVDLGGVNDDSLVALAVAAALGIPTKPDEDPVSTLANALAGEPALLVLDTCEHVVDGVAGVVGALLATCAHLRVLATSRRPIGIRGEVSWTVPPLAVPPPNATVDDVRAVPSVMLFVERAAAVRPEFSLSEQNAADVASICQALDGLPLAIELAAARADVLGPGAIKARLCDRFALLVDGPRDAAARQRTLRAAIDWSFELLSSQERRLFLLLSVFAGPFDLDAATALAGPDLGNPLQALAGLVRQSMVAVVGDDQYRLLDTPREYGRERLRAEGDAHAAHERHARFYVELAAAAHEGIHGGRQASSLVRLRAALPNLRAAIEWSFDHGQEELGARIVGSLSWFFMLEGMFAEGLAYLQRAEESGDRLSRFTRARIAYGIGLLAAPLGRLEQARRASATSVSLAREGGDHRAVADALAALSVTEWALGDVSTAAAHQDEAIELYDALRDPWRKVDILVLRARTALDERDPQARQLLAEAIPLARSLGDRHSIGMALAQLSQVAFGEERYEEAADLAAEALAAHEALNEPEATAGALHLLGRARLALGDVETARTLHRRALELAASIGHVGAICEAIEDFAAVAAEEGDWESALRLIEVAGRERATRQVPLRAVEADRVSRLRRELQGRAQPGSWADRGFEPSPLETVIAELRGI